MREYKMTVVLTMTAKRRVKTRLHAARIRRLLAESRPWAVGSVSIRGLYRRNAQRVGQATPEPDQACAGDISSVEPLPAPATRLGGVGAGVSTSFPVLESGEVSEASEGEREGASQAAATRREASSPGLDPLRGISRTLPEREWIASVRQGEHLSMWRVRRSRGWRSYSWPSRRVITLCDRDTNTHGSAGEYPRVAAYLRKRGVSLSAVSPLHEALLHEVAHATVQPSSTHGARFRRRLLHLLRKYAPEAFTARGEGGMSVSVDHPPAPIIPSPAMAAVDVEVASEEVEAVAAIAESGAFGPSGGGQ